jgi:hypothetical protein
MSGGVGTTLRCDLLLVRQRFHEHFSQQTGAADPALSCHCRDTVEQCLLEPDGDSPESSIELGRAAFRLT